MSLFKYRFKQERISKGITQKNLSEILGVDRTSISKYENGKQLPEVPVLEKMANYFDVSTDYLLGKTDERNYHLVQAIARINRLTNYENLDVTKLDKDTLIDIIQDMIGKIDNTYILKQLFLLIYHQLDTYELIDKVNDKDLVKLRNHLAHNKPSDDELRDFLKIYRNNKGLPK